jgi:hypothetical protein
MSGGKVPLVVQNPPMQDWPSGHAPDAEHRTLDGTDGA